MQILSARHVKPEESARLGVISGWYSTKVSGTFVTGTHADVVEVTGDDDPLAAAEIGAGDDGVTVSGDPQVRQRPQSGLHGIGERALLSAHRRDVADRGHQLDDIGGTCQCGTHGKVPGSGFEVELTR